MESAERSRRCAVCQAVYRGTQRFCPLDGGAIVERVDSDDDPLIGRTIDGRYLVHRRIGRGGMGVVYEAAHIGLDKRIALKFLLGPASDADALARFRREARVASKIAHENVVDILDVGRDDTGIDYLAMELVEGRDLQHVLGDGKLAPPRAVALVRQILSGLGAIHAAGIVHRDLKPSNVIVVGGPDHEVAKIMDFGISKSMTSVTTDDITETGQAIGTPQYMSPEQLLGEVVDTRSDLYAVGLILFALLAGEPPFQGSTMSRLAALHATQAVPSLATRRDDLPAALVEAVARAVARRPEDRYATAADFERALGAVDLATPIEPGQRWMLRTANVAPVQPEPEDAATKCDKPPSVVPGEPLDNEARVPARSKRARWAIVGLIVAGAVGSILYVTRAPRPQATTAPSDSSLDTTTSPGVAADAEGASVLKLARRADADGKLELAIALYADLVSSSPRADLVFRLGELYERVGKTEQAVASFTRYLELAADAADREHVRSRIARLRSTTPPVDAGVAVVAKRSVPTLVDAGVAGPRPRPKRCYCFPDHGSDSTHFKLCRGRAKEPALCRCQGMLPDGRRPGALCSKPGQECLGGLDSDPTCFDGLRCDDPGWGTYTIPARRGEPCAGYRHLDEPIQGTYVCAVCDKDLGLVYEGQHGDPCVGYTFDKGERIEGHLNNCN